MSFSEQIERFSTVFIDTAPIIYFIEAHSVFGPLSKQLVDLIVSNKVTACTSVVTLMEVLPNPVKKQRTDLVNQYTRFLKDSANIALVDVAVDHAELAGRLRGKYPSLRSLDALQIAVALSMDADCFITNDRKLKNISEVEVVVLSDHVKKS